VPGHVAAALRRVLTKTPADRFATAAAFADALAGRTSAGATVPVAAPVAGAATAPGAARPVWWPRRRVALLALAAAAVVAGFFALALWLWPVVSPPGHSRTAIAVLPLENLSAEGPNAYFAGGLHDELLTQLAKVAALKVIGRTSVSGYRGTSKRLSQIADELEVGSIVEGSVQVVGNRLRVIVQLIDPTTEAHLWAEHYDRTIDDAFAVQSDIAQQIVQAVGAAVTSAEAGAIAAVPTANAEAYRLYLQGEEYRRRPGYELRNLEIAERLFERALALDSAFALAHASLSYVHGGIYMMGYDPRPERAARQLAEAEAVLRLAPGLPQAHWAMGVVHGFARRDSRAAIGELQLAAAGLPGSAEIWYLIAANYSTLGDWPGWQSAYERATALDPRDANLFMDMGGNVAWLRHRYQEALAAYDRALALAPDLAYAKVARGLVYAYWQGQLDTLRAVLEHAPDSVGPLGTALHWKVQLALWERRPDRVLALLPHPEQVTLVHQEAYEPALLYAGWAHQLSGNGAAALAAFRGALAQLDSALRDLPNDWRLRASRGLALAGLGRRAEALREAEWLRTTRAYGGGTWESDLQVARTLVLARLGLVGDAVTALEPLLTGPSWWISGPMLRIDPRWDPVRNDPRFQASLRGHGG